MKFAFKIVVISTLTLAGMLLLVSCGDRITYVNGPTTTVLARDTMPDTTTTSTTTTLYRSKYAMYVDRVRGLPSSSTSYVPDEDLVKYADLVCTVLRNGGDSTVIVSSIMENISNDRDRTFFSQAAGIAVALICPEYSDRVTQA